MTNDHFGNHSMEKLTQQSFLHWQSDVICYITDRSYDYNVFLPLSDCAQDILTNQCLRIPFSQFTDGFLDDFCVNAIQLILKMSPPTDQIEKYYLQILRLFLSLIPFLIANPKHQKFLETAKQIITNPQCDFFQNSFFSSQPNMFRNTLPTNYQLCLKHIAIPQFLSEINKYFDYFISLNAQLDYQRVEVIFSILVVIYRYFDWPTLYQFLTKAFHKFSTDLSSIELRNIDEKQINSILSNYQQICQSDQSLTMQIEELQIIFNLHLIKSGLLAKQFNAFHCLAKMSSRGQISSQYLCQILQKECLVDYMLNTPTAIHQQLAKDFFYLFREMMQYSVINPKHIQQVWMIFVKQQDQPADLFIEAFHNFLMALPINQMRIVVDTIIETDIFTNKVFDLFSKKLLRLSSIQSKKLFDKFTSLFFESKNKKILRLLNLVIPKDIETISEIQNMCLNYLQENQDDAHIEYAMTLLKEIQLSPHNQRISFDQILALLSFDSFKYIELIAKIIINSRKLLTTDEFDKLYAITRPLFMSRSQQICSFYNQLIQKNCFTNEMLFTIFRDIILIVDNDFLFSLFFALNKSKVTKNYQNKIVGIHQLSSCLGISELWNLLFSNVNINKPLIQFLINLYHLNYEKNSFSQFISNCSAFLDKNPNSLTALIMFIHQIEDGINKDLFNIMPNRFLANDEYCKVNLIGDLNLKIRLPNDISTDSLFSQICFLVNKNKQYVTFKHNDQIMTNESKLESEMTIEIRFTRDTISTNNFDINNLPSMIIFNSDISDEIFQIMVKNDALYSPLALELLSLIPNLPYELQLSRGVDWANYFSINSPFLFIYRSNIIGNLLVKKDMDWFHNFLTNGGAIEFLNSVLTLTVDSFDGLHFTRLLRICKIMMKQEHWSEFEPDILLRFCNKNVIDFLTGLIIKVGSQNQIAGSTTEDLLINQFKDQLPANVNSTNGQINTENNQTQSNANEKQLTDQNDLLIKVINKSKQNAIFTQELISLCLFLLTRLFFYSIDIACQTNLQEIIKITFFGSSRSIRSSSKNLIQILPSETQISLLLPFLDQFSKKLKTKCSTFRLCKEYFQLLCDLCKSVQKVDELYEKIVGILYNEFELPPNDQTIERLEFEMPSTDLSSGLINCLIELTHRISNMDSIRYLFSFVVDNIMLNGCKYYPLSMNYLELLYQLMDKDKSLVDQFTEKLNCIEILAGNSVNPLSLPNLSSHTEKGLKNLGATCYMNAILQQFFHLPEFRNSILSARISERIDTNNYSTINSNQNPLIQNAQILTPNDFLPNNKQKEEIQSKETVGITENEIVTIEQLPNNKLANSNDSRNIEQLNQKEIKGQTNSSQGELNWLIELQKVFIRLKYFPTTFIDPSCFVNVWRGWDGELINPHKQQDAVEFLQMFLDRIESVIPSASGFFKGEMVYNFFLTDTKEFIKSTIESFVTFPLEVQNHTNLSDSFNTFLIPERFDDYDVEHIGKKSIERHSRIRTPPQVLIIQLKRFEFNLQTNIREKVNDKYIFTSELDLSPIMEDQSDHVYYDLIGIVIHMGSAQGGHYFSHVFTKDKGWVTFNDENVNCASKSQLQKTSYGGFDTIEMYDEMAHTNVTKTIEKNSNAYLLFYRKRNENNQLVSNDILRKNPYSLIESKCQVISNELISDLLIDIQKALLLNILMNPHFSRFIVNLTFHSNSFKFLYRYMSIYATTIRDNSTLSTIQDKCLKLLNGNVEFASFLLDTEKDFYEFCLVNNDKSIRKMFLSFFHTAITIANSKQQTNFLNKYLAVVLEKGDEIMSYYKNFDEFFQLFELMKDKSTDTWVPVFFNFLITSVLEYSENIKKVSNESILQSINLSSIFELLNYIIKKRNLYRGFAPQVFDVTFLLSFIQSKSHTKEFIDFILTFNTNPIQIFKRISHDISLSNLAAFLIIELHFNENLDQVLSCVQKHSREAFLDELTDRILPFNGKLSDLLLEKLESFIAECLVSQECSLRMALVQFLDAAKIDSCKLYKFMILQLPKILGAVENVAVGITDNVIEKRQYKNFVPTEQYFDILTKCVIAGNLVSNVIQDSEKFIHALKKFKKSSFVPNHPRIQIMNFLMETVGNNHSEEFFKNRPKPSEPSIMNSLVSFFRFSEDSNSLFLDYLDLFTYVKFKSLDGDALIPFLSLIPLSNSDTFFRHLSYLNCVKYVFIDPAKANFFKDFLIVRLHPDNWKYIIGPIWKNDFYQFVIPLQFIIYLQISIEIIKKFENSWRVFYDNSLIACSLRLMSQNLLKKDSSFLAKLLAAINECPRTKKSNLFLNCYQNIDFSYMFQISKNYNSGYCHFLNTLVKLSLDCCSKLFHLTCIDQQSYLNPKSKKSASKLISYLCLKNINNPISSKVLLREMNSVSSFQLVDPLCETILLLPSIKDFIYPLNSIILKANDVKIFTGNIELLIYKIINQQQTDIKNSYSNNQNDNTTTTDVIIPTNLYSASSKTSGTLPRNLYSNQKVETSNNLSRIGSMNPYSKTDRTIPSNPYSNQKVESSNNSSKTDRTIPSNPYSNQKTSYSDNSSIIGGAVPLNPYSNNNTSRPYNSYSRSSQNDSPYSNQNYASYVSNDNSINYMKWINKSVEMLEKLFRDPNSSSFAGDVVVLLKFLLNCKTQFNILPTRTILIPNQAIPELNNIKIDQEVQVSKAIFGIFGVSI